MHYTLWVAQQGARVCVCQTLGLEAEEQLLESLNKMEGALQNCFESQGLVYFSRGGGPEEKRRGLFRGGTKKKPCNDGGEQSSVLIWGSGDVAHWLDSLQMGEYRDIFLRNDIQGPELLYLERRDLKVTT
ncbi:DGKD [Cordylochernes scorpioides]|uniref:DGKD n=1 Tax=Cordylochernes scorpioides TaxID=51811 RepID=A0ABY6KN98_9ARAC|nr:DGKD [Cordylochernes scorpioides]